VQSYKLKKRLYASGLKQPKCELCGWAKMSIDIIESGKGEAKEQAGES
jgi:hypothetical protein